MTWATIRDDFTAALDTIAGLTVHDVFPDNPSADATMAAILPGEPLIVDSGHAGKVDVNAIVRVYVTRATLKDSQNALDAFLWPTGAQSVIAAVRGYAATNQRYVRFLGVGSYGGVENSKGAQADVRWLVKVDE